MSSSIDQEFVSFEDLQTIETLDENGNRPFIKIWKPPHHMANYVVSGDSAEGVEDGNFSSTFVIDMDTFEMMAEFHGKVRPDEHARVIASLCALYNGAIAAPEFNTPEMLPSQNSSASISVTYIDGAGSTIISSNCPTNLDGKLRPRPVHLCFQLGKRIVDDVAKDRVLVKGIIKSRKLLDEMKTFVTNEVDGTPEASGTCQDDRVMAWCIALIVAYQEGFGSGRDIYSLYKGSKPDENQQSYDFGNQGYDMSQYKMDPSEVITRLEGAIRNGQ